MDPDGRLAFLIPFAINIGISYAMEAALPYAVTALEAYGAGTAAAFVSRAVHGYTGDFEWSALGTGSELGCMEQAGLALGIIRSYVGGGKVTGAFKNATADMAESITKQATSKAKNVFSWFSKDTARKVTEDTAATTVRKGTKVATDNGIAVKNSVINGGKSFPTNSNREIANQIANGHAYEKHILVRGEFPSWIRTRAQFAGHIETVMNNPTYTKELAKGRKGFWCQKTSTVVVFNPLSKDKGTSFQPFDGVRYFKEKLR